MIETKLFEVRDAGTFIPCIGMRMKAINLPIARLTDIEQEAYLLSRCGYHPNDGLILFSRLIGGEFCHDIYDQPDGTMRVAHNYVQDEWDNLQSGQVIDVEYIMKKTTTPKVSERFSQ